MVKMLGWIALAASAATFTVPAAAISLASFNDFDDGTTQGWSSGPLHPMPPVAVASGGPAGAGDGYLLMQSNGGVAGGRLVTFGSAEWHGDYVAAGVTAITMSVNNLGTTDLSLRLWLSGPFSTVPIAVPAGSGWQTVVFPTTPDALSNVTAGLNVNQLRLYHSLAAVSPTSADVIVSQLGIDNVAAVPEPSSAWLLLSGLFLAALRLRLRH